MDELQNVKFKIIETKGTLDTLQMELNWQEDNLQNLKRTFMKETSTLE